MEIHQSAEDYLECILKLSKCKPVVRSIDIAVETTKDFTYSEADGVSWETTALGTTITVKTAKQ